MPVADSQFLIQPVGQILTNAGKPFFSYHLLYGYLQPLTEGNSDVDHLNSINFRTIKRVL